MSDIEYKKHMSEQEQTFSPLKPHWLKKDFVLPCEAVLIYYQIEPAKGVSMGRNNQIINAVDYLEIYDVLIPSKFIRNSACSIELIDFIKWLMEKGFDIPKHLQELETPQNTSNEKTQSKQKKEIINFNFNSLRNEQLDKIVARCTAAKYWKNGTSSANGLVIQNKFQQIMKSHDIDVVEETLADWISDLSPKSKKYNK